MLRVVNGSTNLGIGVLLFALMVALAGIYGLTQNSVQLMAQEIGTRRALGATDRMIRNMVLWRGSKQVLIGFALAMLLSSPLTVALFFLVRSQELVPVHIHVMLAMLGLYLVVYLAIYTPVRKLLLMEPGEALRYE
jgi:ABC-type antimicrobial peptide transport system permease subunit